MSLIRSLVRPLRTRLRTTLSVAMLAGSVAACSDITGVGGDFDYEQRRLSRARGDWNAIFIRDYEYVVRRDCFCGWGGLAVRVTVLDDRVVALAVESTGEPISLAHASQYPTIDGLFARIQDALDGRAWEVEASYDSRYGFPTDIWIDYERRAADDEVGYRMISFREL